MSSSPAVGHLVSFLIRPLMPSLAPTTIVSLQVYLHRALSSLPQPLVLSAACPPPPAIQQACIVSGVRWDDWIQRLSSGIDLKIFLIESSLAVKLGAMPRRMIWVAANNSGPFTPTHTRASSFRAPPMISFGSRLRMRGSLFPARARARDSRGAVLNPTRVPTLLSCSYTADDLIPECDIDSDSDSDSLGSDIESDSDSSCTSASSATSTSAACSALSRSAMRAKANPDSAASTCQGGVSGGVMLGVSAAPKFQFQPQPRLRRAAVSLSNARRPSGVSQNTVRKTAAATAESWRRCAA